MNSKGTSMISNLKHILIPVLSVAFTLSVVSAFGEETSGEKLNSEARDAKSSTKKNWRKTKKTVRDATGNGSMKADAKDTAKNVGDSVEDAAKDVKNKVD